MTIADDFMKSSTSSSYSWLTGYGVEFLPILEFSRSVKVISSGLLCFLVRTSFMVGYGCIVSGLLDDLERISRSLLLLIVVKFTFLGGMGLVRKLDVSLNLQFCLRCILPLILPPSPHGSSLHSLPTFSSFIPILGSLAEKPSLSMSLSACCLILRSLASLSSWESFLFMKIYQYHRQNIILKDCFVSLDSTV
jgi:hypothetical protein